MGKDMGDDDLTSVNILCVFVLEMDQVIAGTEGDSPVGAIDSFRPGI